MACFLGKLQKLETIREKLNEELEKKQAVIQEVDEKKRRVEEEAAMINR